MEKDESIISLESSQNYIRLQHLLNSTALPFLKTSFTNSWKSKYDCEWLNSEEQGAQFVADLGASLFKDARKIQKGLLKSGDITKWDLPLVIDSLKCFPGIKSDKALNKSFDTLKEIRNKLSHHGGLEIDTESFEEMWTSASEVLITFGVSQKDLDKAKIASLQENKANIVKARNLKEEGNALFKNGKFRAAIEKYSEAIHQPGIPSKDLAVLYSNRSFTHLKQEDYYGAKEDAKGAIHLNPNWWKGHCRLGNAYLFAQKYEQALDNFETALKLDPSKKEVENERDHCRLMIAKLKREDHLDPIGHSEIFLKRQEEKAQSPFNEELLYKRANLPPSKTTPLGMCREGHKCVYGAGVPQSYEMAALWYSKAASKGNAEGMYNLALLTGEGKGVRCNIAESIRLMEMAASQDIYEDFMGQKLPNIGVVEAQHSLGLSHENGVGVPQNIQTAIEWYTRAIKNGSGTSANNMGVLYEKGLGVSQDINMCLNYYKLAASRKIVRAMENVANIYIQLFDRDRAQKWYQYAIKRGSLTLQSRKNNFLWLCGNDLEKPIRDDEFELELIEEVKNGPLKHLIVESVPCFHKMKQKLTKMQNDLKKRVAPEVPMTSSKSNGRSDPYRIFIIKAHRVTRNHIKELKSQNIPLYKGDGNLLPKPIIDLFTLKPIHFQDMNSKEDHIYEGFAIKLVLIEDAVMGKPSISQIAEDENGDVQRIFIYNYPQNKDTQNSVGFGCRLTVVNPYFRLAKDRKPMIRVDDPNLIFLHSNQTNIKRCRYCGNEEAQTVSCRKCKRAFYCSKLCLKKDSTELNHVNVCLKRL